MTPDERLKKFLKNIDDKEEWIASTDPPIYPNLYGDAILFVGSTKQGKSTFINCLLGYKLLSKFDEATEDWLLENPPSSEDKPKISPTGQSETLWPRLYTKNNMKLWDMPGLNDNRSFEMELKQCAMTRLVINHHNSVSFVLVVDRDQINRANQMKFVELLNLLLKYSPNIAQHLFIVVSKSTRDDWKLLLTKLLNWNPTANNENSIKINLAKNIVRQVIENNAGYSFKVPNFEKRSETYTYNFPDNQLLNGIAGVQKIDIVDCPYVVNEAAFTPLSSLSLKISDKTLPILSKLCAFFESESKKRILDCSNMTKEEKLKYLHGFKVILPTDNVELPKFLDFVANNSSSARNLEYYNIIEDLKDNFIVLNKMKEIFGDLTAYRLQSKVNETVASVTDSLDSYIEKVRCEPPPKGACNIM